MSDHENTVLDALGEPMRRRILEVLGSRGAQSVGTLASALPVGRPAVSRHLKVLGDAGLVTHRTHGTRNLYSIRLAGLDTAQQWLTRIVDPGFAAYSQAVRERAAGPRDRPAPVSRD